MVLLDSRTGGRRAGDGDRDAAGVPGAPPERYFPRARHARLRTGNAMGALALAISNIRSRRLSHARTQFLLARHASGLRNLLRDVGCYRVAAHVHVAHHAIAHRPRLRSDARWRDRGAVARHRSARLQGDGIRVVELLRGRRRSTLLRTSRPTCPPRGSTCFR